MLILITQSPLETCVEPAAADIVLILSFPSSLPPVKVTGQRQVPLPSDRLKLPELSLHSGGRVAASAGHLECQHTTKRTSTTGVGELHETDIRLATYIPSAGRASRNLNRKRLTIWMPWSANLITICFREPKTRKFMTVGLDKRIRSYLRNLGRRSAHACRYRPATVPASTGCYSAGPAQCFHSCLVPGS